MNVTMTATLALRREALEIAYTIDNREPHEIGVFNWIPATRPDGTLAYWRRTAYVELVQDILLVRKMALPIPEHLGMAAYIPPDASRIAARSVFVERVVLDVPVLVMQPFRAAVIGAEAIGEVVADRPATARLLRLEIGVFPLDEHCRLESEHPAHRLVLSAAPSDPAIRRQQVLKFDARLDRAVDVLDYRAAPWR